MKNWLIKLLGGFTYEEVCLIREADREFPREGNQTADGQTTLPTN